MAGLKKSSKTGEKAIVKDLNHIHDMKTFIPLDAKKLTRWNRLKSLSLLMFLVNKQYVTIKVIPCDDVSKQRNDKIYNKHDCTFPTFADNNVMITLAI